MPPMTVHSSIIREFCYPFTENLYGFVVLTEICSPSAKPDDVVCIFRIIIIIRLSLFKISDVSVKDIARDIHGIQ